MTGHLILVMAPSGSGKSLLVTHLREAVPELYFAISCTTRDPRPHEKEGETYYFITEEAFDEKIKTGAFLEWAEFGGSRYGTLVAEIVDPLGEGKVVLREVELQGVLAIRQIVPAIHRTVIYIDGGPWELLEKRILRRAPISAEHVALRKERYIEESKSKAFADVIIENVEGHLDDAKRDLQTCVESIVVRVGGR